ncbi:MAG: hypothetical protein ACE5JK_08360, partial [Candidatus Omnitrophota bacterium]
MPLTGRAVRTKINKGNHGHGVCYVVHLKRTPHEARMQFTIPKEYMEDGALGETVVVRVEKDVNQGQIINVYFESEFDSSENPTPIVTYKYFPDLSRHYATGKRTGLCKPVDLTGLDIGDYYNGKNVVPVKGRRLITPVTLNKRGQYRAETRKIFLERRLIFSLLPLAAKIYGKKIPGEAEICLKEDPDYGTYIEASHKGKILAQYYYFRERDNCTSADLERLAFTDWVLGKENIHGDPFRPREYHHKSAVRENGSVELSYRGRKLLINFFKSLVDKELVFVPEENEKYGYVINVHDASKYRRNKKRKPDMKFTRDVSTGKLIKLDVNSGEPVKDKRSREDWIEFLKGITSGLSEPTVKNTAKASKGELTEERIFGVLSNHKIAYEEAGLVRKRRRKAKEDKAEAAREGEQRNEVVLRVKTHSKGIH